MTQPSDALSRFHDRLSLPLIAAPMFLVSGVELVVAACRNGVIGSFPTVNCRSPEQLEQWLADIGSRLKAHADASGKPSAPICANLIVQASLRLPPQRRPPTYDALVEMVRSATPQQPQPATFGPASSSQPASAPVDANPPGP